MCLGMGTRGTNFQRFCSFVHITAVPTDPANLLVSLKDLARLNILAKGNVAVAMARLGDSDLTKNRSDFGEAFLFGHLCETRIHLGRFIVFAIGGFLKILFGGADHAGRKSRNDFDLATFKKLEQTLGMLFFLIRGFGKDGGNLLETFVLGLF
jgi:hypothetical protein